MEYSKHYGKKTALSELLKYEHWNQLDLFDEETNLAVKINVNHIAWKPSKKRKRKNS